MPGGTERSSAQAEAHGGLRTWLSRSVALGSQVEHAEPSGVLPAQGAVVFCVSGYAEQQPVVNT